MRTYDDWKTTEPDPYADKSVGECDCCGKMRPLSRCWAPGGVETYHPMNVAADDAPGEGSDESLNTLASIRLAR